MPKVSTSAAQLQRLLVVDDERSLRSLFSLALAEDGRVVETCADGIEALHAVGRSSFDLILLDLRMPRLDGIGFLRELRASGNLGRVIVCSAELSPQIIVEAISLGVVSFLAKPFSLAVFRQAVAQNLEASGSTRLDQALLLAERLEFEKAAALLDTGTSENPSVDCPDLGHWKSIFEGIIAETPPRNLAAHVRRLINTGALSL